MTVRDRVVVLRALGVGDLLAALPALRGIADAFPEHQRLLAAPSALEPLVRLAGGVVDEVIPVQPLAPLPPRTANADVAFNLHGRGPQSHRVLLRSGPRRLVAFRHPDVRGTEHLPEWIRGEHEVHRWCRLLSECDIPCDTRRLDLDPPDRPVPAFARGATLLHPGASCAARRWPPERFAAVARRERESGRAVVVAGGPREEDLAQRVARDADLPPDVVLAGSTDLVDLAALVAQAARVVCGDTGVAHLATALRTPSVVLFGPVPPPSWGPPPDRPWHRIVWKGRTGDPHADRVDPGLAAITVEDVLAELEVLDRMEQAGDSRTERARRLLDAGPARRFNGTGTAGRPPSRAGSPAVPGSPTAVR